MRLTEVEIQNFKSLRSVAFKPGSLAVFVGPNGAGKSNLCEALDFVGEMYRDGLERAVVSHGGYENISYRHSGRSKSPISFRVATTFDSKEIENRWLKHSQQKKTQNLILPHEIISEHSIAFQTRGRSIRAPYRVVNESISLSMSHISFTENEIIFRIDRHQDGIGSAFISGNTKLLGHEFEGLSEESFTDGSSDDLFIRTESFLGILERVWAPILPRRSKDILINIFQITPWNCRRSGVPSPNPQLLHDGENLPAVIDALKKRDPQAFQIILSTLRTIMPSLDDIEVVITPQRTLGLTFHEAGFARPWTVDNVSDGTIRAVGLLTALFDAASNLVVIEEPENSLHPWAIGQFVEACRLASESKQIFLTTHSPVLIDYLRPDDIWVVSKPGAETKIDRLVDLDPVAQTGWAAGEFKMSEYLDSGIVPGSVPYL